MWISVTQRLPKRNSYVLTLSRDGYIQDQFYGGVHDKWMSGGEDVMYWMYLENPKDLPGVELDSAYKGFWELGEKYTRDEVKELLVKELEEPVSQLCI